MNDFESKILDHFRTETLRPIIERVFMLDQIVDAHKFMESNQNIGKILLKVAQDFQDEEKQEL
jgi:tumor protein p53-inducible protein 3